MALSFLLLISFAVLLPVSARDVTLYKTSSGSADRVFECKTDRRPLPEVRCSVRAFPKLPQEIGAVLNNFTCHLTRIMGTLSKQIGNVRQLLCVIQQTCPEIQTLLQEVATDLRRTSQRIYQPCVPCLINASENFNRTFAEVKFISNMFRSKCDQPAVMQWFSRFEYNMTSQLLAYSELQKNVIRMIHRAVINHPNKKENIGEALKDLIKECIGLANGVESNWTPTYEILMILSVDLLNLNSHLVSRSEQAKRELKELREYYLKPLKRNLNRLEKWLAEKKVANPQEVFCTVLSNMHNWKESLRQFVGSPRLSRRKEKLELERRMTKIAELLTEYEQEHGRVKSHIESELQPSGKYPKGIQAHSNEVLQKMKTLREENYRVFDGRSFAVELENFLKYLLKGLRN